MNLTLRSDMSFEVLKITGAGALARLMRD